jgi:hypothetical protein
MNQVLDILSVIVVIAILVGVIIGIQKVSDKINRGYKETARRLLDDANATTKDMKIAVRNLRLSLGKSGDQETIDLINQLNKKLKGNL